ncbi:MAG: class I SAM-dependent methyltransferase [Parasporobacterium sp.]|nr:class I SAM-dependent methyltransferase [Parasporobacterium sp.]
MWIAQNWKDYEVLDTSGGEKLERWGTYHLLRPDPQVIWNTPRKIPQWKQLNAHYHRSSKGGGEWEFFDLPQQWSIHYDLKSIGKTLTFHLKPFSFKHTGLFPEQAANWEWFSGLIAEKRREKTETDTGNVPELKVLNLFAYTGGATVAAAAAGAHVTHVDASKGMVGWARENAAASRIPETSARWLVDDCKKFVEREIRRGSRYDGIIMDPPSYGRGPKGEIWKIEDQIFDLISLCSQVLKEDALFFLINSYTTGLQPAVLSYMLNTVLVPAFGGSAQAEEVGLPVSSNGLILPCGAAGRWSSQRTQQPLA